MAKAASVTVTSSLCMSTVQTVGKGKSCGHFLRLATLLKAPGVLFGKKICSFLDIFAFGKRCPSSSKLS